MRNAGLEEAQAEIKIARRNINNLRYADDTTLIAEREELKSLLMKVKEESEKVGLKLNIQETEIMTSGLITSWEIDGVTVETVLDFIFWGGSKISADGDCSHEIKRRLLLGRKVMTNLDIILKRCSYRYVSIIFQIYNLYIVVCICKPNSMNIIISYISQSVSSVAQSCPTLCNPRDCSTPGLPVPSPTPRVYSNSCPLSQWCHPTISSSVFPFFSRLQSFPASGSFPMSQFFELGGQSTGVSASASVFPMNIQCWFPLGWTGWISLQSKGLSSVFFNTTVQKHQFFGT